jgi:trimeric autotransporter adhesin
MAIFDGTPGDDTLIGTALDDIINGFEGRDKLSGGLGNDKLDGGAHNDYLNGGADNDTLIGGEGNDILVGDTGNDSMVGGLGDDIYVIDSVGDKLTELAGQGQDVVLSSLVDYTLGANIEGLALGSTGVNAIGNALDNTISGNNLGNKLEGGLGNDEIYGDGGFDTLLGGSGNDTLDGGFHADKMTGGLGNDTYVVNDVGDVVTELAGGGVDLVKTTVNGFMLGANLENLTLIGSTNISGSGNDLANILTGNTGENVLSGGKGNDSLDGGGDQDTLRGGLGDDTYFVDNAADVVEESAGQGKDTVRSTVSYQLKAGQEIETLIFSSGAAIVGIGNEFGNAITMTGAGKATLVGVVGNDSLTGAANDDLLDGGGENDTLNGGEGKDTLLGGAGDDKLNGGGGNDTLDGAGGIDALTGGIGNDRYRVWETGDVVTELALQGHDTVESFTAKYTLSPNVEDLVLLAGAIDGIGNTLDNEIIGNTAGNTLDGGLGNDKLSGNEGADTLLGGSGNDTLSGGLGPDKMTGAAGNDAYYVGDAGDVTTELAGGGTDLVYATIGGVTLGANVENLTLLGFGDITGNGNDLANILTGNDGKNILIAFKGDDTLDGGKGNDTLQGGLGNDTYIVDSRFDIVLEGAGEGKDTIKSSVSYQLWEGQEIETLILSPSPSGATTVTGDGNSLANTITLDGISKSTLSGNGGDDILTGGILNDTLFGGNDNDTLNGNDAGDILFGGFGNDKLNGGEGQDQLLGGAGDDTMTGGEGQDRYYIEDAGDTVIELPGGDKDIIISYRPDYLMAVNVEYLQLGGGALNATGNAVDNGMVGNSAGNILNGDIGNDHVFGEGGNDTLKGGGGFDLIVGGLGADDLYGEADADVFQYFVEDAADLAVLGNDIIHGFQSGVDRIELYGLIQRFGIDPELALSGGFVRLTASGTDTLVQFDRDGTAGASPPLTMATVTNATVAAGDLVLDHGVVS